MKITVQNENKKDKLGYTNIGEFCIVIKSIEKLCN